MIGSWNTSAKEYAAWRAPVHVAAYPASSACAAAARPVGYTGIIFI